ncbi:MAG: autotransporter domain-containing protein [Candidatus Nanoarchaeia archaeon]|nr:autotransporter domain-containing protein [Candidatus Nanoarchaeia archaeon]
MAEENKKKSNPEPSLDPKSKPKTHRLKNTLIGLLAAGMLFSGGFGTYQYNINKCDIKKGLMDTIGCISSGLISGKQTNSNTSLYDGSTDGLYNDSSISDGYTLKKPNAKINPIAKAIADGDSVSIDSKGKVTIIPKHNSNSTTKHNSISMEGYAIRSPGIYGYTEDNATPGTENYKDKEGKVHFAEEKGLAYQVDGNTIQILANQIDVNYGSINSGGHLVNGNIVNGGLEAVIFDEDGKTLKIPLDQNGFGSGQLDDNNYRLVTITSPQAPKASEEYAKELIIASAPFNENMKNVKIEKMIQNGYVSQNNQTNETASTQSGSTSSGEILSTLEGSSSEPTTSNGSSVTSTQSGSTTEPTIANVIEGSTEYNPTIANGSTTSSEQYVAPVAQSGSTSAPEVAPGSTSIEYQGAQSNTIQNLAPRMLPGFTGTVQKDLPIKVQLSGEDPEGNLINFILLPNQEDEANLKKYMDDYGLSLEQPTATEGNISRLKLTTQKPVQQNLEVRICACDPDHQLSNVNFSVQDQCGHFTIGPINDYTILPETMAGSTVQSGQIQEETIVENNPYTLSIRHKDSSNLLDLENSESNPNDLRRFYMNHDTFNGDYIIHVDPTVTDNTQSANGLSLESINTKMPEILELTAFTANGLSIEDKLKVENGEARLKRKNLNDEYVSIIIKDPVSRDKLVIKTGTDAPAYLLYNMDGELVDLKRVGGDVNDNSLPEGRYQVVRNPAEIPLHDTFKITVKQNGQEIKLENDSTFKFTPGSNFEILSEAHSAEADLDRFYIEVPKQDQNNQNSNSQNSNSQNSNSQSNQQNNNSSSQNSNQSSSQSNNQPNTQTNSKPNTNANLVSRIDLAAEAGIGKLHSTYDFPTSEMRLNGNELFTNIDGTYSFNDKNRIGGTVGFANSNVDIEDNIGNSKSNAYNIGAYTINQFPVGALDVETYGGYNRTFSDINTEVYHTKVDQSLTRDRIIGDALIGHDNLGLNVGGVYDLNSLEQKDPHYDAHGTDSMVYIGPYIEIDPLMIETYFEQYSKYNAELEKNLVGNSAGFYLSYDYPKFTTTVYGEFPISNDDLRVKDFGVGVSIPVIKNELYLNANGGYMQESYNEGRNDIDNEETYGALGLSTAKYNNFRPNMVKTLH